MCRLKSAIILKDRVFVPDYDSHFKMLEELGIKDTQENAERLFVRAELSPRNGDIFSPVDKWCFIVDQDIRPDWFVDEYEKQRMIDAVKAWAKDHIHIGVDGLKIDTGSNHYIKDCKDVTICGNAMVEYICENATVESICGNATVGNIYGNVTVNNISESATVKNICDNVTVEYIYGDTRVENIYGDAKVNSIEGHAMVEYIFGNAMVKHICENATVENIYDDVTVENICDNATVDNICGNVTVNNICDNVIVIGSLYGWRNKDKMILSDNSTFKDRESKIIYQAGNWEVRLIDKSNS